MASSSLAAMTVPKGSGPALHILIVFIFFPSRQKKSEANVDMLRSAPFAGTGTPPLPLQPAHIVRIRGRLPAKRIRPLVPAPRSSGGAPRSCRRIHPPPRFRPGLPRCPSIGRVSLFRKLLRRHRQGPGLCGTAGRPARVRGPQRDSGKAPGPMSSPRKGYRSRRISCKVLSPWSLSESGA